MVLKDIVTVATSYLQRYDIPVETIYTIFKTMMEQLYRKAIFKSLITTVRLTPSSPFYVVLPSDFYDSLEVMASAIATSGAYPLRDLRSVEVLVGLYGTRNLSYIQTSYSPSAPIGYVVAAPQDVFNDPTSIIPPADKAQKSLIFFPPLDTSYYEIVLTYLQRVLLSGVTLTDNYENPLMRDYPEWVALELAWRLAMVVRDTDSLNILKALAQEKFLEVKAMESALWLEPHPTLHIVPQRIKLKPLPGPKHPES